MIGRLSTMAKRRQVLADHKRQGSLLVPPFVHMLGSLQEVSWVNTMIPEVTWIGLIQYQHGHRRGVELITAMTRALRKLQPDGSRRIFGPATIYSEVTEPVWVQFRAAMAETGDLFQIQESLEPLIALYPECPLAPVFAVPPAEALENALTRMRRVVSSLYHRRDRDPMMVQATFVWLAFDADVLKVAEGLSLARFPEIQHYPDTDISRQIGGAIRSMLNGFFGQEQFYPQSSPWPRYFWNRGLALAPCQLPDDD
jgi:hypothetical protein